MKKGNIAIACPDGMRIVTGYIDPVHQIGYAHPEGGRGWAAPYHGGARGPRIPGHPRYPGQIGRAGENPRLL